MKLLHLTFIPKSADAAILLLRLWFGGSLLLLHGLSKVTGFSGMANQFVDPLGIGKTATLVLVVFAEVVCAGLVAVGLFTRFAALVVAINMAAAFWFGHGGKLAGARNGEMAFLFLGAFLVIFLWGAGRFSVDARMGVKG